MNEKNVSEYKSSWAPIRLFVSCWGWIERKSLRNTPNNNRDYHHIWKTQKCLEVFTCVCKQVKSCMKWNDLEHQKVPFVPAYVHLDFTHIGRLSPYHIYLYTHMCIRMGVRTFIPIYCYYLYYVFAIIISRWRSIHAFRFKPASRSFLSSRNTNRWDRRIRKSITRRALLL